MTYRKMIAAQRVAFSVLAVLDELSLGDWDQVRWALAVSVFTSLQATM